MPTLDELAFAAEHDIGRTRAFFPILAALGNRWAAERPFAGCVVGANLHLTTLTAAFLRELSLGGARVVVSASNPGTTDAGTVHLLRGGGIEVYTGGDMEDRHAQVLDHGPTWLIDTGFDLVTSALGRDPGTVQGAAVLSRTGIDRLRARTEPPPFPILNALDGRLRDALENKQGLGEAVWQSVTELTGILLSGRRAAIIGYGPVGRGLAAWARAAGMTVQVVETDPVRALFAHYDGMTTGTLDDVLKRAQIVVTATGRRGAVTAESLAHARDGVILLNAGTGGDEIDVQGIQRAADGVDHIGEAVVRYTLPSGHRATILGHGHPINIVLNSGSPESVLLQYSLLGLGLEWMIGAGAQPGEVPLPDAVERRAAELALQAIDRVGA